MILIISPMVDIISVRTRMQGLCMDQGHVRSTVMHVGVTTESISVVLYALARIGLLVEAAYLLRDMPDSALHVVDWMYFLPHI